MNDLKAAVIGTGGAARLHLQAYAGNPHTSPVAIVSTNAPRAQQAAQEFGVRGYTAIAEMLERERPDIVSVATLEWDHEAPVLRSLEAGSHVLCEKIMAHTIAIGERMVAAARSGGRTLGVNFNYRSVPSHALIENALVRGDFGAPALFSAHMHAYLWPHMLDLLRYLFGDPTDITASLADDPALRPPVSAASHKPWKFTGEMLCHPSIAVAATFRFCDPGFVATMSSSAMVPLEENFWSFALYGDEDSLSIRCAMRANLNGTASLGKTARAIAALPPCSYEQSFHLSVAGFVEAVLTGSQAPVTGEDGLAQMRLDAAIVDAARTGRTIRFAP